MKTDIINTNYLYDSILFKIWKIVIILYGMVLLYLTSLRGFEILNTYESIIYLTSQILFGTSVFIPIINQFLFSRIGSLEIRKDTISIKRDDLDKIIDLTSIHEVTLRKYDTKFYSLKFPDDELIIELNKTQLSDLKAVFGKFNIKIKHYNIFQWIAEWWTKKFN